MLAIVTDAAVVHGPLDLLCTVQEEAGLVGAAKLDASIVDGKTLLNLDSEDEGIFTIGVQVGVKPCYRSSGGPASVRVVIRHLKLSCRDCWVGTRELIFIAAD